MDAEERALLMTDLIRAKECLKKDQKKVPVNEIQEEEKKAAIAQSEHRISYLTKALQEQEVNNENEN